MRRPSIGTTAVALSVTLLLGLIATPTSAQALRDVGSGRLLPVPAFDPGGVDTCMGGFTFCMNTCLASGGSPAGFSPVDWQNWEAGGLGICYRPPKGIPIVPWDPPFDDFPGELTSPVTEVAESIRARVERIRPVTFLVPDARDNVVQGNLLGTDSLGLPPPAALFARATQLRGTIEDIPAALVKLPGRIKYPSFTEVIEETTERVAARLTGLRRLTAVVEETAARGPLTVRVDIEDLAAALEVVFEDLVISGRLPDVTPGSPSPPPPPPMGIPLDQPIVGAIPDPVPLLLPAVQQVREAARRGAAIIDGGLDGITDVPTGGRGEELPWLQQPLQVEHASESMVPNVMNAVSDAQAVVGGLKEP